MSGRQRRSTTEAAADTGESVIDSPFLRVVRRVAKDHPESTVTEIALAQVRDVNVKGMVVRERTFDSTRWTKAFSP